MVFVQAYAMVKKASAIANTRVGWLNQRIGNAIFKACDEVLIGKFLGQFVIDAFHARSQHLPKDVLRQ
jgi:aspartate ammonia-lyase